MASTAIRSSLVAAGFVALICLAAGAADCAGEVDHSPYDALLKQYTRDGLVDYGAIREDRPGLEAYIETLSDSSASHYRTWSRESRMAFWINAYNALTIYAVVINYPIKVPAEDDGKKAPAMSARHIESMWDTAYVELAGRALTLHEIEREVLLEEFGDPRVLFALAPASKGGPLLSRDAYLADSLEVMLERDAVRFVNDGAKVRVNITRGRLYVSEIFEANAGYFEAATGEEGGVPEWLESYRSGTRGFVRFIAPRVDALTRDAIMKRALRIDYLKYDFSLNDLPEGE
jgi:hypothetical protein